jgi:hypothetical protein
MLLFTVLFGFFGLHHLMLRSPQTAFFMLITNFVLFGYPWLYDVIQLLPESWGGHGTENLNKYGMGHAFGALGLGQGMWLPDDYVPPEKEPEDAPPSPWWFILYVILLPITFLAPLLGGDSWGALAKLGYNFFFFGWFLGMCAFAYDLFYLLLKPADLFAFGLKRFFPFTFFMDKDNHSPSITGVRPPIPNPCPPSDNFFVGTLKFFIGLAVPVLYVVNPPLAMSLETAVSSAASGAGVVGDVAEAVTGTAKKLSEAAITSADIATDTVSAVVRDGSKLAGTIGTLAGSLDSLGSTALSRPLPIASRPSISSPARAPQSNNSNDPQPVQAGGGQGFSALDYAAFGTIAAVIGGAFLLTAGRSYGVPTDKGDSPPNA